MNAYSKIENETIVNMTSKGQVLLPKAVRDKIGLIPGKPVRVGTNDRGEAVIIPQDSRNEHETTDERRTRIMEAIMSVAGKYKTGQSTDEYMEMIRGPYEE